MCVRARTVRITLMVIGGFACAGDGMHAQETPPSRPARPITESAERLAQELWAGDDRRATDEQGRPLFRTNVTVSRFVLPLPWQNTEPAFGPVQPRGRLYHQEFLSVVTPEPFRAGAVSAASGAGVGMDPGAMFGGVRTAFRNWQARRARERIEREAAQLRARAAGPPSSAAEPPTGDEP